jgi:hypothetical protein
MLMGSRKQNNDQRKSDEHFGIAGTLNIGERCTASPRCAVSDYCDYCHGLTGHKAKDSSEIGLFIAVHRIILKAQP